MSLNLTTAHISYINNRINNLEIELKNMIERGSDGGQGHLIFELMKKHIDLLESLNNVLTYDGRRNIEKLTY